MPKSDILPLRRCPCWPGPYSRLLTGLFGRPKTFSPMRRSSLYLALLRFDMSLLQFAASKIPEPHRQTEHPTRNPLHRGAEPIAQARSWRLEIGRAACRAGVGQEEEI